MIGIWVPMVMTKKVCQRLTDQTSSLRSVLICPSQLIGLKKMIHLGVSSSWDSSPVISVRSTESSTVDTMNCCECRLTCSTWHESTNVSLRSRKDWQWMSICWVTLWCEGMTVTAALEGDLSSRSKEVSKRWLSCGERDHCLYLLFIINRENRENRAIVYINRAIETKWIFFFNFFLAQKWAFVGKGKSSTSSS